jgi:hypothetical protein
MRPTLANLIYELNGFGEDGDTALVASMYRHLAHWPAYLALVRTMLVPLQESGELQVLLAATRRLGNSLGATLAGELSTTAPRSDIEPVLHSVRRFVRHPIARMTGVCAPSMVRRRESPRFEDGIGTTDLLGEEAALDSGNPEHDS